MLSDKITSFFFLKEEKVAFNEKKKKKPNGYLKIFIHHCKNMFYIFKTVWFRWKTIGLFFLIQ